MGGNVSSSPSAPSAKGSASPVRPPNAPGFGSSLGSMGNVLRGISSPQTTQVQQPMAQPSMMGNKSSGAGQGGYGGAPGFQQPTAQNNPTATPFSPYGPADPSTYTTSYPNRPSPPSGGKSLGGVSPYGDAPGFGGQPFDPRFSPAQMENRSRFQGSRLEGDNIVDASGRRIGAIGMAAPTPTPQQDFVNPRGTMSPEMQAYYAQDRANQAERFNRFQQQFGQPQFNQIDRGFNEQPGMQQGFVNPRGSMAPDLSEQGYRKFLATARFSGTPPTYEQWAQNQGNRAAEQASGAQFNQFQQPQFNRYQQPMFNPYQQPMQPQFDQQQAGLMALSNLLGGIFGQRGRRG